MTTFNSGTKFITQIKDYGDTIALIWKHKEYSYSHLITRIIFWRNKLNTIPSGSIVGLESDFSPETISILLTLIELNVIIVPLDINHTLKNFKKAEIAQLDFMITIYSEDDIQVEKRYNDEDKNDLFYKIQDIKAPGLVLFTSGSSGKPKGALHNLSKLLTKFEIKRNALRTINFLLFDHWGGLNTMFHILSNGGNLIILENRTPNYVCEIIEKHKIELLPTSPTFLNMMLISRAYENFSLESLKIISYGAEPMPESLLLHLDRIFPKVKLQQTYGLIELGVMRTQSESNNSLWVKLGGEGYEIRVVDKMLQIKSNSAMLGYLNAVSPFTEDGWFKTGDAVEIKGEYFKILGRNSEIINVGGEKVFPQEVENIILQDPKVKDVLVYSEDNRLTGKIVCAKIKYNSEESKIEIIKRIKTHCRAMLQSFKVPVKIELVDESFESNRFKKNRING